MNMVYKNAVCNLAATGFLDGQNGLFVSRNGKVLETPRFLSIGVVSSTGYVTWLTRIRGSPESQMRH
jgi:hypothetical protein